MGEREKLFRPEVEHVAAEDIPHPDEVEGEMSIWFWAAPVPSNWRKFLNRLEGPPLEATYDEMLRSPHLSATVETGLLRRYIKEDMERKDREGKFTPSPEKLERHMWKIVNEMTQEEEEELSERANELLKEITDALKPQPTERGGGGDLSGLTRGIRLDQLGGPGDPEGSAIKTSIAEMFTAQTDEQRARNELLRQTAEEKVARLQDQLDIVNDLLALSTVAGGKKKKVKDLKPVFAPDGTTIVDYVTEEKDVLLPKRRFSDLEPATQAFIERRWRNEVYFEDEYGTSKREMTLRILSERKEAPAGVHVGWERQVYEALVDRIFVLHEEIERKQRLRAPQKEIDRLKEEIDKVGDELIAPHVISYTRTTPGRQEYGPVGTDQVDLTGFEEAQTFNQLHRAIIIPVASPYPPSWEAMGRRVEINTCVMIAQMALDELTHIEGLPSRPTPTPSGRPRRDTVSPEDRALRDQIDAHNAASPVPLRKKLEAYLRQPRHDRDFYDVFAVKPKVGRPGDPDYHPGDIDEPTDDPLGEKKKVVRGELHLISQLTGISLGINPRTSAVRFDPRKIEMGRNPDRSRRAFINVWKIENQSGRVSTHIITQMFDRPERYPGPRDPDSPQLTELKAILDDPSREMVVSVCGFPVDRSMGGGSRQEGRGIDEKAITEQKRQEEWTDRDWYAHWLDELQRQRETGVRPERMLLTQTVNMVQEYLLRRKYFAPEKNISFIVTEVPSEDSANYGGVLKYMHASGLPLTSKGFEAYPIAQSLEQPNEFGCMIVHDKDNPASTELEVRFRDTVLTERGGATPNFVDFFKQAILNELQLAKKHANLGGPMVSVPRETPSKHDMDRFGAYLIAFNNYVNNLIATVETTATASSDPTETLENLLNLYRKRLQYITYDMFDKYADPIKENAIIDPEFADEIRERKNELARIRGSVLKKNRETYADTLMNERSTPADIATAREEYLHNANELFVVLLEEELLGMKATGQLPTGKEADRRIAELAASIHVNAVIDQFIDVGRRCWDVTHEKNIAIPSLVNRLFRNIVGSVSETALIQYCEAVAYKYNLNLGELGDRRKIPDSVLVYLEENKKHAELVFYIAAQMATAVNIGRNSEEITAGGREILQKLLDVFRRAGIKEGADTTDRLTDADWLHHMHTVEKERGILFSELIARLLDETTLRDIDKVDTIIDQWRPTVPDDERTTFRNLLRRLLLSYEGMLEQSGWRNEPGVGNIRTLLPRIGSRRGRAINRDQSRNDPPYGRDIADRH